MIATLLEWKPIIGGGWYSEHSGRHYEVVKRDPADRFPERPWGLWIDDVLILAAESAKDGKRYGQSHADSMAEDWR